jgi:hypothetical protein
VPRAGVLVKHTGRAWNWLGLEKNVGQQSGLGLELDRPGRKIQTHAGL